MASCMGLLFLCHPCFRNADEGSFFRWWRLSAGRASVVGFTPGACSCRSRNAHNATADLPRCRGLQLKRFWPPCSLGIRAQGSVYVKGGSTEKAAFTGFGFTLLQPGWRKPPSGFWGHLESCSFPAHVSQSRNAAKGLAVLRSAFATGPAPSRVNMACPKIPDSCFWEF